jgi:hypothetical protein
MNTDTASNLANLRSRRTIGYWREADPELSTRIGGRILINEERFFDKITNGSGLLTWEQAKTYAASLVGHRYLCGNLDSLSELERLVPEGTTWLREGGGFQTKACVSWKAVARLCHEHGPAAKAEAEELGKKYGKRYGWKGEGA